MNRFFFWHRFSLYLSSCFRVERLDLFSLSFDFRILRSDRFVVFVWMAECRLSVCFGPAVSC